MSFDDESLSSSLEEHQDRKNKFHKIINTGKEKERKKEEKNIERERDYIMCYQH